jgi:hypothetical protein
MCVDYPAGDSEDEDECDDNEERAEARDVSHFEGMD